MASFLVDQGFRGLAAVWLRLRDGERTRGAEQIEGPMLGCGRRADLVEGVVADGDGIAGQGAQVLEQAAEAAHGQVIGSGVAGTLAGVVCGAGGRGDRVGAGRGCSSV